MTYDDILDWTDDYMPDELFDDYDDWEQAVKDNFAQHGHYFPEDMSDSMKAYWEEKNGKISSSDESDRHIDYLPPEPKKIEIYYTRQRIQEIRQTSPKSFEIKYVKEPTKAQKFANVKRYRRNR